MTSDTRCSAAGLFIGINHSPMSHRRREKNRVKSLMGALAIGRKSIEAGESYQLREPATPYKARFGAKKGDIGPENTHFWNVKV